MTMIGSGGAVILTVLAAWILYTSSNTNAASANGPSQQAAIVTLFVHLAGAAACIFGAVKMFRLRRNGLYYFIPGVLIPDVVSGMVFGKAFFQGGMLIVFIMPLLFIIAFGVYFLNTKKQINKT